MKPLKKISQFVLVAMLPVQLFAQVPQSPPPATNFSASPAVVCVGEPVQFTDKTLNEPTTWNWTFNGGSPATSTLQHPVVIYPTAGKFSAVLTAGNASGNLSKGQLNIVTVEACVGLKNLNTELNLDIFPNPVHTVFSVKSDSNKEFSLSTALGVELMTGTLIANETRIISLESYPAGIYFISVRGENKSRILKIIKE